MIWTRTQAVHSKARNHIGTLQKDTSTQVFCQLIRWPRFKDTGSVVPNQLARIFKAYLHELHCHCPETHATVTITHCMLHQTTLPAPHTLPLPPLEFPKGMGQPMQVLRFEDMPTACLPVTFAPWDPQLLVFAEEQSRVYITGRAKFHETMIASWAVTLLDPSRDSSSGFLSACLPWHAAQEKSLQAWRSVHVLEPSGVSAPKISERTCVHAGMHASNCVKLQCIA